jgi:hypothetical protein
MTKCATVRAPSAPQGCHVQARSNSPADISELCPARAGNEAKKARIKALRYQLDKIDHQKQVSMREVPHADELQRLEAAIKETEQRLVETDETRSMYLQMIDRLRGESTSFTRDMNKVKATADAKEADEVELVLMLKEALHARDDVKQRAAEFEHGARAEQRRRERELAHREKQLERRREQTVQHEARCARRRHELMVSQEQARASMERQVKNPSTVEEELLQIQFFETEFKQIQNVAGASEVQDVIAKFRQQEQTYNMLNSMTLDSRKRIDHTREATREAQAAVERFRFEGIGESNNPRDPRRVEPNPYVYAGDAMSPPALTWSSQQESRLRRVTRTLVDMRAGVQHLIDLLASAPIDLEEFQASLDTDDQLPEVRARTRARRTRAPRACACVVLPRTQPRAHCIARAPLSAAGAQALEHVSRNITKLMQQTTDPAYETRARLDEAERGRGGRGRKATEPEREEVYVLTSKLDNFRLADLNESEGDDDDDDEDDITKHTVLSSVDIKVQSEKLVVRHTKPKRRKGKVSTLEGDADAGG